MKPWIDAIPQPVAITGGTGFVGSHLVDVLCAAGIEPRVLVRDPEAPRWIADAPVRWVVGSLSDPRALKELVDNAGTVFHLAGVLRAGREREFDVGNRLGTASVLSAMQERARSSRLVDVSSLAAVGPSRSPEGVGPEAAPAPISWYGRSKLAAEDEVRKWEGDGGWSILRPPAIYGPRDTDVFEFFRMASVGLVGLPAGERWLTVAWVGDVVRSILAAASGIGGEVFHLGDPEPLELEGLIESLCEVGGVNARVLRVPPALVSGVGVIGDKSRELLARHWTARTDDSLEHLGVTDLTRWRDGAGLTWTWYRDQGWLN
ncbi:MAG: NAD(P)-dependent oxidoreductase [Acidobacteriota bacterium]